jgi:integral membrane sensor domain MASE1
MEYLISIIGLLFAIPLGFLLKSLTKEELEQGRKYFEFIWVISFLVGSVLIFLKPHLGFSFLFMSIISFISWKK